VHPRLPALSLEYLGDTVEGKTALPVAAGAGAGAGEGVGRATSFFSVLGAAVVVVGGAIGVAVASAPHSALRKSFHFIPLSVPACWQLCT
jgi:hypothetical protein